MALTAKQKRVQARLQQIRDRAAQINANTANQDPKNTDLGADLAEEAAGLALDLLEEKK
jgi:hypothetical protein